MILTFGMAEASAHNKGCNTIACDKRTNAAYAKKHPMRAAVASWYGPGLYGNRTACGQTLTPGLKGVAHKGFRCGTKIRFCKVRCTTARVIDRGPFVGGRTFDLTGPLKHAIGCGDICTLRYRILK